MDLEIALVLALMLPVLAGPAILAAAFGRTSLFWLPGAALLAVGVNMCANAEALGIIGPIITVAGLCAALYGALLVWIAGRMYSRDKGRRTKTSGVASPHVESPPPVQIPTAIVTRESANRVKI